jgi:hypothetical protein
MLTDTGFSLHVVGLARTVSQHVLELFAAVGTSRQIDRAVRERFGGLADRASIYELDPEAGGQWLLARY